MVSGAFVGTAASAELLPANEYREFITIQLQNDTDVSIAFGEAAVVGECLKLSNTGEAVTVRGWLAQKQINIIGDGAAGAYQEGDISISI